jgi:hypothetical protein
MGRTARVDIDNGRYHVMNRGVHRQVVFFSGLCSGLGNLRRNLA